jgi:hypothetical protein
VVLRAEGDDVVDTDVEQPAEVKESHSHHEPPPYSILRGHAAHHRATATAVAID